MSDLRKAAEMALEAWDWDWSEPRNEALRKRMEALRQALAQDSLRKLAEIDRELGLFDALAQPEEKMPIEGNGKLTTKPYPDNYESKHDFRKALAQSEQRGHCTCGDPTILGYVHFRTRPCIYYTAPPKREWVGLTDDEFEQAVDGLEDLRDCWTQIEAKLKEKNNG